MIRPTLRYLRRQTCPRCWRLIFSFETVALVAVAVALWFWGYLLPLDKIKIAGVTGAILSYASIAFGFCLTGMALSLTIPDRAFAIKMATTYAGDKEKGLMEKTGYSFRHNLAHGFVGDQDCFSPAAVNSWWLVLRLCLMSFGLLEEIRQTDPAPPEH